MMKTVLAYGDSNTWGAATVARPDDRYAYEERWPGVMAATLGGGWRVIEEGLPGRTTVHDDPVEGAYMNGKTYLMDANKTPGRVPQDAGEVASMPRMADALERMIRSAAS